MSKPQIEHVVVLLLENRSFDHMLGFLDHPDPKFPSVEGQAIGNVVVTSDARYRIDSPDHSHTGVLNQMFGGPAFGPDDKPPFPYPTKNLNQGYIQSFTLRCGNDPKRGARIMRCFHPKAVPVISTLAKEFAVCTNWHCSVPGETWPNRDFAVAATSDGFVNQHYWVRTNPTIFEQLDGDYRIYHDSVSHTFLYKNLYGKSSFSSMEQFFTDVAMENLPKYSYLEPDFGLGSSSWFSKHVGLGDGVGNSQHPGQADSAAEFIAGEYLMARIYEALRATMAQHPGDEENSLFAKTLFVLTYDEHGGFYDHAPPRQTVAPDRKTGTFKFDVLGPRVPAILISPWIKPGKIVETPFDHSSIPATVRKLFAPDKDPLTARDAQAETFDEIAFEKKPKLRRKLPEIKALDLEGAAAAMQRYGAVASDVETWAPDDELRKDWAFVIERADSLLPPSTSFSAAEAAADPEGFAIDVVRRMHTDSPTQRERVDNFIQAQVTLPPEQRTPPGEPPRPKRQRVIPTRRPLKAYASDPSRGTLLGNRMTLGVRYEELLPGPTVADRYAPDAIAVIDYDATNDVFYDPVDLDDPDILIAGGIDPTESDPRFHQQMVYAVVTETIQNFEAALGRKIHWRRPKDEDDRIYTLNLYPHAMVAANAYYCPKARGILFGYFRAKEQSQGRNLPGQIVYTCLSHDIIVHETTHAIVDGIRTNFTERSNPDVAAFHEGFADLVALFRHFSHTEVLLDTIRRTGGMIFETELAGDAARNGDLRIVAEDRTRNPLIELAQQFGEARGRGKGLRSALGVPPNATDILSEMEPHARGSILVAAVFDAYFAIYLRRTKLLFQVFRAGGGRPEMDLPEPLAQLLAREAAQTAQRFFTLCVRALDYCPPTDLTFGDYLRALITSDLDVHPTDGDGLRDALMQAFRVRGIVPDGAAYFSDTAIAWPRADLPAVYNLEITNPNGLTREEKKTMAAALHAYVADNWAPRRRGEGVDPTDPGLAKRLGLAADWPQLGAFNVATRIMEDGSFRVDLIVELVQERQVDFASGAQFPMRGGCTLIISLPSVREIDRAGARKAGATVRYAITKSFDAAREASQRNHYQRLGLHEGNDADRFTIDFALMHGGL